MTATTDPVPGRKVKRETDRLAESARKPPAKAVAAAKPTPIQGRKSQTSRGAIISYNPAHGVDSFVQRLAEATPMELVEVERHGVKGRFVKDLSRQIEIPAVRLYEILGVPKATVEKRSTEGTEITGAGGQAAIAMARLLAQAREMAGHSVSPQAKSFDAARWLGQWIERAQPALGGRKPAELIATPTGAQMVSRLLGAIESGAYQ